MPEASHTLFIHKYQPLTFDDFGDGNARIVQMMRTLIAMDDLNVLLIGNMASGKTTMLNALVREYYTGFSLKDYQDNVLLINNLKEQGINYYRTDVKIFCQTCSKIRGKKKFVVLDDIDLINEQSQQVFRNCMDKYSHNVHFVASCTNHQKVIESLQSRLSILKMEPLSRDHLVAILNTIQSNEHLDMDDDAKEFVVSVSNNTVKLVINYLEKFKLLNQRITLPLAIQLCTNISFLTFEEYTRHLLNGHLLPAIQLIYQVYDKGYSVMDILDNYFLFVKNTTMLTEDQKYGVIPYLCKYISVFHTIHEDEIELALFTNNLTQLLFDKNSGTDVREKEGELA